MPKNNGNLTEEENQLIDFFIDTQKYKDILENFVKDEVILQNSSSWSNTTQIYFENFLNSEKDNIDLESRKIRKKLLPYVSRQFERFEMVVDIEWLGSDYGVFYETGFDTDAGVCDWITPNTTNVDILDLQPGSQTGDKNGLNLILDAEVYDYGLPIDSSGFKLALLHHLDMPIMSQSSVSISPGTSTQIGTNPSIIDISDYASKYDMNVRNCYHENEVYLTNLRAADDYKYAVSFQKITEH